MINALDILKLASSREGVELKVYSFTDPENQDVDLQTKRTHLVHKVEVFASLKVEEEELIDFTWLYNSIYLILGESSLHFDWQVVYERPGYYILKGVNSERFFVKNNISPDGTLVVSDYQDDEINPKYTFNQIRTHVHLINQPIKE